MRFKYIFLIIVLLISFSGENMFGETEADSGYWAKPTFVKWDVNGILLGGITPKEIDCIYIWSVEKKEMLWYMSSRTPRYTNYSKRSRDKSTFIDYGVVRQEWRQWIPNNSKPQEIKNGELIRVYFSYPKESFFGPSGEEVSRYLIKSDAKCTPVVIDENVNEKTCKDIMDFIYKKSLPPFGGWMDAEEIQKKEGHNNKRE